MNKKLKTVIILAVAACVLAAAIFVGVAALTARKIYDPDRKILRSTPDELGLYFEELEGDLSGWFIPAKSEDGKTVIISHNYADNMEMNEISLLYTVKFLVENGCNVVTFDYSGSGSSDGNGYSFGQTEEVEELKSVISETRKLRPDDEIILYGLGFGGAAAARAANDEGIEKIIADSLYADLSELLDVSMSYFTGSKSALFNSTVKLLLPAVTPISYSYPSPKEELEKTENKKILLIYGEKDGVLPSTTALTMKTAAEKNNEVKLYLISDCEHLYGSVKDEYNYKNVILAFIKGEE